MKKKRRKLGRIPQWGKKLFSRIIYLIFITLGATQSFAQSDKLPKISIQVKDETFVKVIESLQEQSGYEFVFKAEDVMKIEHVTLSLKNVTLDQVLDTLLAKTNLIYLIENKVILIKKKNAKVQHEQTVVSRVIHGIVLDKDDIPLPGVTIRLKDSRMGVVTDNSGKFRFAISRLDPVVFVFSFVGYKTQEVEVKGNDELTIRMIEDVIAADEIVVTGYGNFRKGNYTGASTTVNARDVIVAGASSIDQMLQGVIPGMMVKNLSGQVGSTPKIRVRGTSSLLGSQEPVWVVDGVIQRNPQPFNSDDNTTFTMDADDISKLAGNAISWLNPYDIETITVLKDASAMAIYGSQAANGVIVITTKKAQSGRVSVLYNGDFSIGQRPRYGLYDLMNSREIMEFSKEMYEDRLSYPSVILPLGYAGLVQRLVNKEITLEEMNREYVKMAKENTDWFDLLFRNSFNHKHNISINGGSEKIRNRTSFSINQEKGEAKGNDLLSISMVSNTEVRLGEKLIVNLLLNGGMRKVEGFAYGVDPFTYAYNTSRIFPAYNEDGTYYYHEKWGERSYAINNKYSYNYNVLNELSNTGSENNTKNWNTTLDLNWNICSSIRYQGVVSYASSSAETKKYATERSFYITQYRGYEFGSVLPNSEEEKSARIPKGGLLETGTTVVETITVRNSLTYDQLFSDKHRTLFQIGLETNSTKTTGGTNKRYGYLKDRGETFANVPQTIYENGSTYAQDNSDYAYGATSVLNRKNNLLSAYAQAVYTYDERYILNFNARVDASNRFGQDKNKRFEPNWSAGIKWRVGNEIFLGNCNWLNSLDLTVSYGYQGNSVESVSPYLIAVDGGLFGIGNYYQSYVLRVKSLPYPNLGWEKTKTYNLGLDIALLNNRLNATFNYYRKNSDVLSSRDVPYENGMVNCVVSGSEMENTGYEFVVEVVPIQTKDFTWKLSLNSSSTRNKITKNNRGNTLDDFLSGKAVVKGKPFSTFYSYKFKELDQTDGTPLFENMDIESAETPLDYLVESGKFTPDFSGGLNTMLKYKNWTLYALFSLQWGGNGRLPVLYDTQSNGGVPTPEQNVSRKLKDRWRNAGDQTIIPSVPGIGQTFMYLPPKTGNDYRELKNVYESYNNSDLRVAKTDMIRCNSLSLAYEFNQEWLNKWHVNRMMLKATMMNPFMWVRDKKWDGIDPETGNWPTRRVTSLSFQIAF